ncbi:MAG: phosphopyruvate hydratase [Candidatus Nanopelagicales bacterium]
MKITQAQCWLALDSRGEATVAVKLTAGEHSSTVVAPAGASTGGKEIPPIRDGATRNYLDTLTNNVVNKFNNELVKELIGQEPEAVDELLDIIDGPALETKYGTHVMTATSVASNLLTAKLNQLAPYEFFAKQLKQSPTLPMPMVNIISGAAHAQGAIDIQDILCIPNGAKTFSQSIHMANQVRRKAKELMQKEGFNAGLIADEGGLAANFDSNRAAIALVTKAIRDCGFQPLTDVSIAIDFAANQFLTKENKYHLACEGVTISGAELAHLINTWVDEFPIISIEDPVAEADEAGWQEVKKLLLKKIQVIGDDRFATDAELVKAGIERNDANSVLVKPNQTGTLKRAAKSLELARSANWTTVVSARSGETEDSWLSDLATGWNAGQIKVGSTMRSERTAKWNRLLELEATTDLPFATEKIFEKVVNR